MASPHPLNFCQMAPLFFFGITFISASFQFPLHSFPFLHAKAGDEFLSPSMLLVKHGVAGFSLLLRTNPDQLLANLSFVPVVTSCQPQLTFSFPVSPTTQPIPVYYRAFRLAVH